MLASGAMKPSSTISRMSSDVAESDNGKPARAVWKTFAWTSAPGMTESNGVWWRSWRLGAIGPMTTILFLK